jgi:L-alanine-DL-glutamate epimerase-like enolase superfamily enzyme
MTSTNKTLKITRIQVDELDPGPLPVPFQDSTMGPFLHWKLTSLRLTTDDGRVGQSFSSLPPDLRKTLLSEGPRTLEEWWHRIYWMQRNAGHRNPGTASALANIDMAMNDILAQRAGLPLHRFLGATRDVVPVYGSGGGTNRPLPELIAEMKGYAAEGFKTLKMKVGKDFGTRIEEDITRVKAVREAIGPNVGLAVDANQCWSSRDALAFAERVAPLDIAWFEEPVHSADRKAIREVSKSCPFDVAMGESENHPLGFRDYVECGVQHLQPPPHGLPGFSAWAEAVAFARENKLVWSSGGSSHLTAIYVGTQPDGLVECLKGIVGHWAEQCWSPRPLLKDGLIHLPATPGLPLVVVWERLRSRGALQSLIDERA